MNVYVYLPVYLYANTLPFIIKYVMYVMFIKHVMYVMHYLDIKTSLRITLFPRAMSRCVQNFA